MYMGESGISIILIIYIQCLYVCVYVQCTVLWYICCSHLLNDVPTCFQERFDHKGNVVFPTKLNTMRTNGAEIVPWHCRKETR